MLQKMFYRDFIVIFSVVEVMFNPVKWDYFHCSYIVYKFKVFQWLFQWLNSVL